MKIKFLKEELEKKPEDADFMLRGPGESLIDVVINDDGGRTGCPFVIAADGLDFDEDEDEVGGVK